jgi:mono/diheme cytochrome c family protein
MKPTLPNLLLIFLTALMLLTACGSSQPTETAPAAIPAEFAGKTNPFSDDQAAITSGQSSYETICASCHGPDGQGDGPAASSLVPPPANLAQLAQSQTDDYLLWRISSGKDGTAMVAWGGTLSEKEIWQIIAYLKTLQ